MERSAIRGRSVGAAPFPGCAALHPGDKIVRDPTGKTPKRWVNPLAEKYSTLPKFGFVVCVAHPGSTLRGDRASSRIASRACGGRGSVGTTGCGQGG